MSTKGYFVNVPIVGYISVEVEAESEDEAMDLALDADFNLDFKSEKCELVEFDVVEYVSRGNVCSAPVFEVEIEDEWEIDE